MRSIRLAALGLAVLGFASPSSAITVVPTSDEGTLEAEIFGSLQGLTVTNFVVSGHTQVIDPGDGSPVDSDTSTGTYENASGTYGIGPGVVLSTGDVADYEDGSSTEDGFTSDYAAPATAADDLLLDLITPIDPDTSEPYDHYDVTRIDITFDADATVSNVYFTIVFGSEEFNEFIGSAYIDTFGIFFNGSNVAIAAGSPVNINHPDVANLAGTELDGVVAPGGNPLLVFQIPVAPNSTGNTLTFIIADTSDEILDSTVYISGVSTVPEPSVLALGAIGSLALIAAQARRRSLR